MDRIDMLAEKIDAALRDETSGGAVFDMLPAWVAEYTAEHGTTPGTSGGSGDLAHFMRETTPGDFDEEVSDGQGSGMARLGRCVYRWDDSGFYGIDLLPSIDMAREDFQTSAERYDTGEEG